MTRMPKRAQPAVDDAASIDTQATMNDAADDTASVDSQVTRTNATDDMDSMPDWDVVSMAPSATLKTEEDPSLGLALRSKQTPRDSSPTLQLHPLEDQKGVIVKVQPPPGTAKVPIDVVLVIDVSGSMQTPAPAPDNAKGEREIDGLTVLDLTKHAARAIIETLGDEDRLAAVTFSDSAQVSVPLMAMTKKNKEEAWNKLSTIQAGGCTALWNGLMEGKALLEKTVRPGAMPAIMLLTDGQPNRGCPEQGYVPRLRSYDLPAPIHTFGFGHGIGSPLLQSIAEVSGGNFAFIPDASMLATVFIHAVANLQTTYATDASLTVTASGGVTLCEAMGEYIHPVDAYSTAPRDTLTVPLSTIQQGQSRDILLRYGSLPSGAKPPQLTATLSCKPLGAATLQLKASRSVLEPGDMPLGEVQFHQDRAALCSWLTSLAPLPPPQKTAPADDDAPTGLFGKIRAATHQSTHRARHYSMSPTQSRAAGELGARTKAVGSGGFTGLTALKRSLPNVSEDELAAIWLREDVDGQLTMAMKSEYYDKWGFHYLLGMYNAHFKQLRTSFKDPGPQAYSVYAPIFNQQARVLSDAFDTLPPPKATTAVQLPTGETVHRRNHMTSYNSRCGPCFAAPCRVRMHDDALIKIEDIRPGMCVWTPVGPRAVQAVVGTPVLGGIVCRVGNLAVTPWHPVYYERAWRFPDTLSVEKTPYIGNVYSLLLEPDVDENAHAIEIERIVAVTLGHGVQGTDSTKDARAHPFYSDHAAITTALCKLPLRQNVHWTNGIVRGADGLTCAFLPAPEDFVPEFETYFPYTLEVVDTPVPETVEPLGICVDARA